MRRVLGFALVVALLAGAVLAPSAGAKVRYPRLDPSFGSGGYVSLPGELPGPEGGPVRLEYLAAAPGGAVYASETKLVGGVCHDKCVSQGFLARVNSDGSIAPSFGGGGRVEVGSAIEHLSPPAADSEGRALVVSTDGAIATVHRYLADGSPDPSFGSGGSTSFDCGCGASASREIKLGIDGRERIVVSINTLAISGQPTAETLARLLPGGAMDASFGAAGILQLGAVAQPLGIAFGSNDAIYTWGQSIGAAPTPYLHRVSAKGRNDTTFNAAADRTLKDVGARGILAYSSAVLVVRPHGLLDLYGGDGMLRLRSNGSAETKFGQAGVKQLGWTVLAASLVGNGKVLGLGNSSEGVSLIRLQSNGKPDRSFGSEGARLIDGLNGEEVLGLARLNGRRAQVLSIALNYCRFSCSPPEVTLVRYRIGPKQG